jgi:hypothetical protein
MLKLFVACGLLSFLCFGSVKAQSFDTLSVKEDYDRLNARLVEIYDPCGVSTDRDHLVFGDGMSHVLDGYITMYQTTGDKAYLYKFVLQSLCMLENRHDLVGISKEARWGDLPYEDGNIVGAFAHFVFFIEKQDSVIKKMPLYAFDGIKNNALGATFETFGDFSKWLGQRVDETIEWYVVNQYWDDRYGFLAKPNSNEALILNKQIGFARAVFYMELAFPKSLYTGKAMIIANLMKGNIAFHDRKKRIRYNQPVLQLTDDNAYWWYHYGWSLIYKEYKRLGLFKTWNPSYEIFTSHAEDMSHGAVVLYLPMDFYKNSSNSPFTATDMLRFRNTFVKNVYDGTGGFYNTLRKTDGSISDNRCSTDCPHSYHAMTALMYMPYAEFDSVLPTERGVYPIVMDFYRKNVANSSTQPKNYCCGMNKGHAEVVQAQWKREAVNLTLYKRKLVYSQNFHAKNTLVIAPENGGAKAYADPIITTDEFTVEPGVKTQLSAGNEIILRSGTHFKSGSEVHLIIK